MTRLLINEPPLQVLPTLAQAIGLNDSIFVQQLHWWLGNKKVGREHDGYKWVKNSIKEWQEDNFPFWHVNTITKIVNRLEAKGIIKTTKLNAAKGDHTLYYTIDYDALDAYAEHSTQRV